MSDNKTDCPGTCEACDAGCGFDGTETVTLELDGGISQECQVIAVFPASNHRPYIALLPLDENGQNDDGEVYLYRFTQENGEPGLDNIETDEEYEIASDAFDEWLDRNEFDEIVSAEDE